MKTIIILIGILSVLTFSTYAQPIGTNRTVNENDFIKEYLERFENSKEYLMLVAKSMPKDKYEFKATPESMSFAENLMHIGWAMDWHSQSLMGGREARNGTTDMELKVGHKSKKK